MEGLGIESYETEQWIVVGVIVLQFVYGIYAAWQLRKLSQLIPERHDIKVGTDTYDSADTSLNEDLTDQEVVDVLANDRLHDGESDDKEILATGPSPSPSETFVLVAPQAAGNTFRRVIEDINQYSRNKLGSVSDFALVKDVVDRPVDAELAQAEQRVSTPLYLGLIGAIAGIVAGVYALASGLGPSNIADTNISIATQQPDSFSALTSNLKSLLNAVGLAMTASGFGVFITLLLSLFTRRAEAQVDARRNDFFTLYQVEFLPKVSNNIDSVLQTLSHTIETFNTGFSVSIKSLEGSLGSNLRAVESQAQVLKEMREINASGVIGETAKLYEGLVTATAKLEELQPHFERTYSLMRTVGEAGEKFHATAGSVEKLGQLEKGIRDITEHSRQIQAFMNRNMEDMDRANTSALGASQQIVEAFREHQAELRQELHDVTTALKIIASNVEEVTRTSIEGAQERLIQLPNEIDGMVRTAFDSETVSTIKRSTKAASDAAEQAQLSAKRAAQLTELIDASVTRQSIAMDGLEERSRQHTEVVKRLLQRRPWYRRMFAKDNGYSDVQK